MTTPIIATPVVYDPVAKTSCMFRRELEAASVDLVASYKGHQNHNRVGGALSALSLLLTGVDHHLRDLETQLGRVLVAAQKPDDYVHEPDERQRYFGVMGRNTFGVQVAMNSYLYFSRSLLDQAMGLISCSLRVSAPGSMNGAAENSSFRKKLRRIEVERLADLVDEAWAAWGRRLKEYRDLLCHRDAFASPSIELIEDAQSGQVTGARIYLPDDPSGHKLRPAERGRQYVNVSTYFHQTRDQLSAFLGALLAILNATKRQ